MGTVKNISWVIVLIFAVICSCGGGGGGDSGSSDGGINSGEGNGDGDSGISPTNVSGVWRGLTNTDYYGKEKTVFDIIHEGNNISGTFTCSSEEQGWHDETKEIYYIFDEGVTVLAAVLHLADGNVTYVYYGTVNGNTYSGEAGLVLNDESLIGTGNFTLKKEVEGGDGDGGIEEQCKNNYAWCVFNCGSNATCCYDCAVTYNNCLQGNSGGGGGGGGNQQCMSQCGSSWISCSSICTNISVYDEEDIIRRQKCYNECDQKRYNCEKDCN